LLPLAGTVGIHVAKNLQSKPEVPDAPHGPAHDTEEALDMNDSTPAEPSALDKTAPVGELASRTAPAEAAEESIDLDDADLAAASSATAAKKPKSKKDKKLKVPNFNKFRTWLIFGGIGGVALIVILFLCLSILPKATITVKTDSVAVSSNVDLTLSPTATSVKVDAGVVPAKAEQAPKTLTQQVDATGQRNDGTKASGSVTITNCAGDASVTIPAGSGFTAAGKTFVSTKPVSVPASNFTSGGKCKNDGTASVDVVAQNAGADYNLGAQSYTIAAVSGNVTAQGSSMSGGTDKITKVVAQADIDSAKQKIEAQDTAPVKQELQTALKSKGLFPIAATFSLGSPTPTSSSNVGDEATSVTVTEKITYTMQGAKRADLEKLITASVNKQIDPKKQKILDSGLDKAVFQPQNQAGSNTLVTMQTNSVAGSSLDTEALKKQVAGKKANDAKEIIKANPSITDVSVHYSPFWVSSIPKKTSKITIQIEKPQTTSNAKP